MRVLAALEEFDLVRDPVDHVVERTLPASIGLVHALGSSDPPSRFPEFYERFRRALCGTPVKVLLPTLFDGDDPDVCPTCSAKAAAGATFFRPERGRPSGICGVRCTPGEPYPGTVLCTRSPHHDPPHRAATGETWTRGSEDFTPAPDGYV